MEPSKPIGGVGGRRSGGATGRGSPARARSGGSGSSGQHGPRPADQPGVGRHGSPDLDKAANLIVNRVHTLARTERAVLVPIDRETSNLLHIRRSRANPGQCLFPGGPRGSEGGLARIRSPGCLPGTNSRGAQCSAACPGFGRDERDPGPLAAAAVGGAADRPDMPSGWNGGRTGSGTPRKSGC